MICLLVVAKAPVAGLAKTRLCPPAKPAQAADIAAAALLDTLDAVLATADSVPVVAMAGDLTAASHSGEIADALRRCTVISQRGNDFGERLANAHSDTAALHPGLPVLQIGMDTPQITPALLTSTAAGLDDADAVLGPAEDGGWWALALRDAMQARALRQVPMSRADTAERTIAALPGQVRLGARLSDVDTMADALAVAEATPNGRFAATVRQIGATVRQFGAQS